MGQIESACEFCDEFAGGNKNAFSSRYRGGLRDRTLLATGSFRVFPTIGQLVEGYLLLAPFLHYTAVDAMPVELIGQFAEIIDRVRTTLLQVYGPSICFEHGARSSTNGGCGIYHAHVHAVPLVGIAADPIDQLRKNFPYTEFANFFELTQESLRLPSYLSFQDSKGKLYLFDTGPLPSQYMRKLLAESLGNNNWDWRAAGVEERLHSTIEKLSSTPTFSTPLASLR